MMKKKTKTKPGGHYYEKAGFSKPLLVFLSPELHAQIKKRAEEDERTMQVTARRILEAYFTK